MLATRVLCSWTQEGISASLFFCIVGVFSVFVSGMVIPLPNFGMGLFVSVVGMSFVGAVE